MRCSCSFTVLHCLALPFLFLSIIQPFLPSIEAGNPYGAVGGPPPPVAQAPPPSQWGGGNGAKNVGSGGLWPVPNWPAPPPPGQQQQQQYPQPVLPQLPQHACYVYPCDPGTTPNPTSTSTSTASTSTGAPSTTESSSSTSSTAATGAAGLGQNGSTTVSVSSSPTTAVGITSNGSSTTASATTAVSSTALPSSTTSNVSVGALGLAERTDMLNLHNDLRASLANGTARNMTGTMPSGTNMIQLAYNTSLETSAQFWAKQCTFEHASAAVRNDSGENLYWTSNLTIPTSQVLLDAGNLWWRELVNNGIQANLTFISEYAATIGHWAQMAWSNTRTLGCAVNVCSNATYVVCRYWPAGNFLNQLVYTPGTRCNDCASSYGTNASCNASNGLCLVP